MQKERTRLEVRQKLLLGLKETKEKAINKAPDGTLHIHRKKKKVEYYHRDGEKKATGRYIRKNNMELAKQLAQKDYDIKILKSINKELNAIQQYISNYPTNNIEEIYSSLSKERQKLIIPIIEADEDYVKRWQEVKYQGKAFAEDAPEIYTAKDERVRSKSEMMIADTLNREGIPYRYEYPIIVRGLGTIYPDFHVLNVRKRKVILWEHFGRMDDPEYVEKAIRKINAYIQDGYIVGDNLIITFETKNNPLNQRQVLQFINHYLK